MEIPLSIKLWLLISGIIVLTDIAHVLLRPRSMKGGDLESYFIHYQLYIQFDALYGDLADRFVVIQSYLNFPEIAGQFYVVYKGRGVKAWLVLMVASALTFWKTVIYMWYDVAFLTEASRTLNIMSFLCYYLPNSFWLILPVYCIVKGWYVVQDMVKEKED